MCKLKHDFSMCLVVHVDHVAKEDYIIQLDIILDCITTFSPLFPLFSFSSFSLPSAGMLSETSTLNSCSDPIDPVPGEDSSLLFEVNCRSVVQDVDLHSHVLFNKR